MRLLPTPAVFLVSTGLIFSALADPLTMEVVNDSETSDDAVYLFLSGKGVVGLSPGLGYVDLLTVSSTATNQCTPLTNLTVSSQIVSPLTGKTNNVYTFQVTQVTSARLFVSFDPSFQFVGATAPTNVENYRYDKMEVDYSAPNGWAADLTSVDFYGIPMMLDAIDVVTGESLDYRTFYISKNTILADLKKYQGAIQSNATNGSFYRLLSPQTVSGNSSNGSAAPYPPMSWYLTKYAKGTSFPFATAAPWGVGNTAPTYIDDSTNTVTVGITNYNCSYSYKSTATQSSGNFKIVFNGSINNWVTNGVASSGPPILTFNPAMPAVTNRIPSSKVMTMAWNPSQVDFNAYGCAVSPSSFVVSSAGLTYPPDATMASSKTNYFLAVLGNSPYATALGDLQAGLNYGFVGGRWGIQAAGWYNQILPPAHPFGSARNPNDGFYNPYAAEIYNVSDSYGFAYSDRLKIGIPVLMDNDSTVANLRVTVLPDNQLDAPRILQRTPMINPAGSLPLMWNAVTNAPAGYTVSYLVDTIPPLQGGAFSVSQPSVTLTNLVQGLPYFVNLYSQAVAPGGASTNTSFALPVLAGTKQPFTNANSGAFTFQFGGCGGWLSGVFSNPKQINLNIAGQALSFTNGVFGPQPIVWGSPGTNYYPVSVYQNGNSKPVFQTLYKVVFTSDSTNSANIRVAEQPYLYYNSKLPTVASSSGQSTVFPTGALTGLVIDAPGAPIPPKQCDAVKNPQPPSTSTYDFEQYGVGP